LQDLIRYIDDPDPKVRAAGILGVSIFGAKAKAQVPKLVKYLVDSDHEVRAAARKSLSAIDAQWRTHSALPDAMPQLVAGLKHENKYVRAETVQLLGELGETGGPHIAEVMKAFGDYEVDVDLIVKSLARIDAKWQESPQLAKVLPELGKEFYTVTDPPDRKRYEGRSVRAMAAIGAGAVPELVKWLPCEDELMLGQIVKSLEAIGPAAKDAIPELAKRTYLADGKPFRDAHIALDKIDPDWQKHPRIGEAMPTIFRGALPPGTPQMIAPWIKKIGTAALPELEKQLESDKPVNQQVALIWLAHLGPEGKAFLPKVRPLLTHKEAGVRDAAATALANVGVGDRELIADLMKLLVDPGASQTAYHALEQVDKEWRKAPQFKAGLNQIIRQLSSQDPKARRAAASALTMIGPDAKPAVPTLQQLERQEKDPEAKRAVSLALTRIGR
jgi:HEAT repeat protein